jgi:hypothetical protein
MFNTGVVSRSLAGAAAVSAGLLVASTGAWCASDLSGSWRGGGSVSFISGKAERARCRASFSRISASSYAMNATCATPSGSVTQSATVRGSGNRFRGSFYNAEWDTSGSIAISVSGRRMSVSVSATKGSASMSLSR